MEEVTRDVLAAVAHEAGEDNVEISIALVGTASNNYPINFIYLWTAGPRKHCCASAFATAAAFASRNSKSACGATCPTGPDAPRRR